LSLHAGKHPVFIRSPVGKVAEVVKNFSGISVKNMGAYLWIRMASLL